MNSSIFLVTGGLGFIGKHFIHRALSEGHMVINVDHCNYASDMAISSIFHRSPNYHHIAHDISTLSYLPECDFIINFAAESHVDNSISSSLQFCHSNFLGVQHLLELVKAKAPQERPVFFQISTDEVYGDIEDGLHNETDVLKPSNPYSATKASADLLIQSYARTYGLPYILARPSNNYGPHQYPEKLIPKSALRMKRGLPAIIHGPGNYIRSWLHVEDTVDALMTILQKGEINTIYNINGDHECENLSVVKAIAKILNIPAEKAWVHTEDRAGQDIRYSMNDQRIRSLGWRPTRIFEEELVTIVETQSYGRFLNEKQAPKECHAPASI